MNYSLHHADAIEFARSQPDDAFDLTFTSPPFEGQRRYATNFKLTGQKWVDWMRPIIVECARATKGLVIVNMSSPVKDGKYTAAVEWLVADLTRCDGLVCGPSPYAWTKNGVPGSGGKKDDEPRYHRRDWEPVYCFARPEKIDGLYCDPLMFGSPPKFQPGGAMTNRNMNGKRKDVATVRYGEGFKMTKEGTVRTGKGFGTIAGGRIGLRPGGKTIPAIANPGNVIHVAVGGNLLGSGLAHRSHAPMPLKLAERFVCWYCPPKGKVFDPFVGSGTTGEAALIHGRRFVGCDINDGEGGIATARQRLQNTTPSLYKGADSPHAKV